MQKNNKQLMFAISNSLSKPEAISFARSMDKADKWYITCVYRNPEARHIEDRERWVVVRDLRKGEIVPNGYALFVDRQGLLYVQEPLPQSNFYGNLNLK